MRPSGRGTGSPYHDFNPRTPCGVRPGRTVTVSGCVLFQSTHPLRGATWGYDCTPKRAIYFNPRTPCGVRPYLVKKLSINLLFQSTHPLRGATPPDKGGFFMPKFQSTHPLRGATYHLFKVLFGIWDFNPRTPCGVRRSRTIV